MEIPISILGPSDIDNVNELMKQNSNTLGFLPFAALSDYLGRGTVLGAKADDGSLAGYLLYASNPQRFRIAHLCISDNFRGTGLARRLFEALKAKYTTQSIIQLNCRRDYDANELWPNLGFIPVSEKPGRSQEGHPLTSWEYRIREDNQLDLFKVRASEQALDVVIDAHILFHFGEPVSPESTPSKALLADFLVDLIFISLTDEIFLEINRHTDPFIRENSRRLAQYYPVVNYDHNMAKLYEDRLASLLQPRNDSDVSDIRHLAKTAASDVGVFVTRDDGILRHAAVIARITQLEIVEPVDLVLRMHELHEKKSYERIPVSGQEIAWRRAQSDDSSKLVDTLRLPGELKGQLRVTLHQFLADPETHKLDILWRGDQILGARASTERDNCLTIPFVRAAQLDDQGLVERFLVSDSLATCVAKDVRAIRLKGAGLPDSLELEVLSMGFQRTGQDYGRLCLTGTSALEEIHQEADRHFPELKKTWSSASDREILTRCSPVAIQDFQELCFVVPIRPGYAMSLFDKQGAADDMFGGRFQILMRWENVYYRSKSQHRMLTAPARVLWYESREVGAITAVSHLQAVEIKPPKELFRKFRKLGTLDWEDVYEICKGDIKREIMALKFSHTFTFRQPVSLDTMREIEGRKSVPLQSPRIIDNGLFHRILKAGFPEAL